MSQKKPWTGQSVLIVDDSKYVRDDLRELYQSIGMTVVGEAKNGVEALELASKLNPDLVSLDIIMPEMNGIECYQKMQLQPGNRRYIIISALAAEQQVINGLEGVVPRHLYLSKPATQTKLEERLKEVYDGPQIPQLNAPLMEVEGF